jgi:hypothetical protein
VIFGFTFSESGNYMFSDATKTENYMFIVVTTDSGRCPSDTSFTQPMNARQLAGNGGSQSDQVIKDLDTALVFSLLGALFLLLGVLLLSVGYCLHKSWIVNPVKVDGYRKIQRDTDLNFYITGPEKEPEVFHDEEVTDMPVDDVEDDQ